MAKTKELKIITVLKLFFKGTKIYFKHLDKFLKYMAFPVLGQLLGVLLILVPLYLFTHNIENIVAGNKLYQNISLVFLTVVLLVVPGFVIFLKAFWDYLVAYAALSSMASNLASGAKLEDLKIHNDTVYRRYGSYIILLLLLSLLMLLGVIPLLSVLIFIFMIYLTFVFQIFALEEDLSPIEGFKKSISAVKGNFLITAFLLVLLFAFTYWFLPNLIAYGFEKSTLTNYFVVPVQAYFKTLPFDILENSAKTILPGFRIDIYDLSYSVIQNIIGAVVIGFTLPLRTICCLLLYRDIEVKQLKAKKIKEL